MATPTNAQRKGNHDRIRGDIHDKASGISNGITCIIYLFLETFPDAFPLPKRYQVTQSSTVWLRALVAL